MSWTIEAKVLPIVGLGGHLYLEIFNDKGERATQINGLSVCRKTNKIISIGKPGDKLKAYVSNDTILATTSGFNRDNHPHEGHVIYEGTKDEIMDIIQKTKELAEEFNSKDFLYQVLSFNSNTVFSAMVHRISQIVTIDQEAVDKTIALRAITPGVKPKLISKQQSLSQVFNTGKKAQKPKRPPSPPSL